MTLHDLKHRRERVAIGLMSGTSCDGVDAALEIRTRHVLLRHQSTASMDGDPMCCTAGWAFDIMLKLLLRGELC